MTVKYFPWDTHNCASAFGSWTLSNNELSLEVLELLAPPRLFKDNVWDIVNNGYGLDVLEFADKFNEVLNYTLLTYSLTFHRRDGFLAYLIAVPAVLMSFLTLIALYLPADSQEKISVGKYCALLKRGFVSTDFGHNTTSYMAGVTLVMANI